MACHKVEERNCQIVVMADKWELVNGRRLQMPMEVLENAYVRVVVVGGEAADHTAVETLKTGKLCRNHHPFDQGAAPALRQAQAQQELGCQGRANLP